MSDTASTVESLGLDGDSVAGPELISSVAGMSAKERRAFLDNAFERLREAEGDIVAALGEVDRGQDFRDEGATSTESWVQERYGVSLATARRLVRVGKVAWNLPHLVGSLRDGYISLDKVQALAEVATPETDAQWRDRARQCSVRDLVEVAKTSAASAAAAGREDWTLDTTGGAEPESDRGYVRFNDQHRTLVGQLPPDRYAEVKTCLEAAAKEIPSEGDTPWDGRLSDALLKVIRSQTAGSSGTAGAGTAGAGGAGAGTAGAGTAGAGGAGAGTAGAGGAGAGGAGAGPAGGPSPFFVVAHVPLASLVDGSGQASPLAGELEHVGLIDIETVQRIACDATVAVAVDDDVGHTMYEGRARRFPTRAQRREVMRRDRHCRFPGCTNVTFANVHHIVPWEPDGTTDLDNLVLACLHHHHLVHSQGWSMTGNANEELTITGPTGRVMTSRPSPLWTRVSAATARS